jgi:WD40 repeat protein
VRTLSDHTGSIRGLCICNDKLVSCSDDGVINVWTPGTWTCARTLNHDDGAVNAVVNCRGNCNP